MRDTDNGGSTPTHPRRHRTHEEPHMPRASDLNADAEAIVDSVTTTARDAGDFVRNNAERRPYLSMGVAAGVGFVLAGGLSSKFTSVLLGFGGRLLLNAVLNEVEKKTH